MLHIVLHSGHWRKCSESTLCLRLMMLLDALAEKAGSLDVAAMDAAAEGLTWTTPRGDNTLTGRHMAQTIYLADGSSGAFEVVTSFDSVASSEACAN